MTNEPFPTLVILCLVVAAWNLGVRIQNRKRRLSQGIESCEPESDYWPDWIAAALIAEGLYLLNLPLVAWIIVAPGLTILTCLLLYKGSSSVRLLALR